MRKRQNGGECDTANVTFLNDYLQYMMTALKEAGAAPLLPYAAAADVLGTLRNLLPLVNKVVQRLFNEQTINMGADALKRYLLIKLSNEILTKEYGLRRNPPVTKSEYSEILERLLESVDWERLTKEGVVTEASTTTLGNNPFEQIKKEFNQAKPQTTPEALPVATSAAATPAAATPEASEPKKGSQGLVGGKRRTRGSRWSRARRGSVRRTGLPRRRRTVRLPSN
jgi:hypothetical protein